MKGSLELAALSFPDLHSRLAMQDSLLQRACQAIELTPTMYNDAAGKYRAVGEWLGGGQSPALLNALIYPQGSMALGTTVRPLSDAEFDLDLVCRLRGWPRMKPAETYDAVYARLQANGIYRPIIERKPRCLRLNYAGNFHLDVVPAWSEPSGREGAIVVPDRKLECWCPSNPEEFARRFFAACQLAVQPGLGTLSKRAELRPLPSPMPSEFKYPLQRIVQLLKRFRDLFYAGDADAPASIVITTLAIQTYAGAESISAGLRSVLDRIQAQILFARGVLPVLNPTNPDENFTANWSEERYHQFKRYIDGARRRLDELAKVQGFDAVASPLGGLFGQTYAMKAINTYTAELQQARERSGLRVLPRTATLTTSAAAGSTIPRNNFYGRKY